MLPDYHNNPPSSLTPRRPWCHAPQPAVLRCTKLDYCWCSVHYHEKVTLGIQSKWTTCCPLCQQLKSTTMTCILLISTLHPRLRHTSCCAPVLQTLSMCEPLLLQHSLHRWCSLPDDSTACSVTVLIHHSCHSMCNKIHCQIRCVTLKHIQEHVPTPQLRVVDCSG